MIERKTNKFQKFSVEEKSRNVFDGDSIISSVSKKRVKNASETANSILEELGVKKTNKNSLINVKKKVSNKKSSTLELEERGISILNDLKNEKIEVKDKSRHRIENKNIGDLLEKKEEKKQSGNKAEQKKDLEIDKFGFNEKFVAFLLICIMGFSILAFVGGYIKFDLTAIRQVFRNNVHQLEFLGEFRVRQVENGYNRVPLFVVEGTIRNSFYESEDVKKIQLKAFAFDHEQSLIDSHFTYAGIVLSDEQLETLSPINIKELRQTRDPRAFESLGLNEFQINKLNKKFEVDKDMPFQVVFFKDVSTIKSTSIEIVSYVLNDNFVYLSN